MADNNEYMETIDEEIDDSTVMTVDVDETLTVSGEAADAYVVGQRIATLNSTITTGLANASAEITALEGEVVKTVQGITPVNGEATLDTLLAAQADVTGDVDALFV